MSFTPGTDLDPAGTDLAPDSTGAGSEVCWIWIRQKRIQFRFLPELLDPGFSMDYPVRFRLYCKMLGRSNFALHDWTWLIAMLWSAVQCSAVQCSAIQCCAVQCTALQCFPRMKPHQVSGWIGAFCSVYGWIPPDWKVLVTSNYRSSTGLIHISGRFLEVFWKVDNIIGSEEEEKERTCRLGSSQCLNMVGLKAKLLPVQKYTLSLKVYLKVLRHTWKYGGILESTMAYLKVQRHTWKSKGILKVQKHTKSTKVYLK